MSHNEEPARNERSSMPQRRSHIPQLIPDAAKKKKKTGDEEVKEFLPERTV